jgi:hypothetical protein
MRHTQERHQARVVGRLPVDGIKARAGLMGYSSRLSEALPMQGYFNFTVPERWGV